ncbi:mechanosensitive ion channel family protein [Mesorhizobium sp. M8A.F.Ca.ET.173.01.1.1]|nr:mechanosensitive ion channel family protein [Mesorhizobium sp. M8A.F.Ca.ET.173.01.1.1]
MSKALRTRICILLSAGIAIFFWALLGTSLAQQSPAGLPPEKARQFLNLLSDPEVKQWLEGKIPAAAEEPPAASLEGTIASWEGAVRARLAALADAIPRIPQELANAAGVVSRDVNSGRPGLVVLILAVLIVVGFGAEWLVRRALASGTSEATIDPGKAVLSEVAALLTFALASIGSFLAFEWPPLLRKIVLTLLLAFIIFRAIRAITKSLLALGSPIESDPSDQRGGSREAGQRFWQQRVSAVAGFFFFGWAIVSIMPALGFSPDMLRLVALSFGLGLLAVGCDTVWRRPSKPASPIKNCLLTLYLVVLWLVWVAGVLALLWIGLYALLLPSVVRGVGSVSQAVAGTAKRSGAVGVALNVFIVRGARAGVIAAAIVWLAYVWRLRAAAFAHDEMGARIISGSLNAIVILMVADLFWQLAKALIAYRIEASSLASTDPHHAAPQADPHDAARAARLRTLLPIFRNALAVLIGVVAVLSILAGLGVQIMPLIAGAGVFGVAIGFGSQTLVKDMLSGVFYLMDDAFRVGEYIQSGSYKGTVESFSLRSVRLRHHRGPVYTVPFGQLGAIQNMSRDWVIDKITIGVTYDSDVELARKLVKKIGQELAQDPEFAADTIEPLKMQGIDAFGDFAVQLSMKMTTKPGTQFPIKRRAFMMIKKAFEDNNIKIAFPTVHVEGGDAATAAAAQQQIAKMSQAEAAACQA